MPGYGERLTTLDGLRGLAALAVVVMHNRQAFGMGGELFGHAYLAVDFFFMLSGFVLMHAYAGRLHDRADFSRFLQDRALRLLPLVMFGTVLGAIAHRDEGWTIIPRLAANGIGLPAFWMAQPFLLDPPAWSLFWELLASVGFGWVLTRGHRVPIGGILTGGMIAMILVAVAKGNIDVGLAVTPIELPMGAPRIVTDFLLGVLVYRRFRASPAPNTMTMPLIAITLLVSLTALPNRTPLAIIYDPVIVFGMFPMLLLAGARSTAAIPRLAVLAGSISYPLYIVHDPLIRIATETIVQVTNRPVSNIAHMGCVLLTVPVSYLVSRWYDEPVRRWLKRTIRTDTAAPTPISSMTAIEA